MSERRVHFIPFSSFAPDSPEFAQGHLEEIANALPVYGSHRPTLKLADISEIDSEDHVNGVHVHRTTEDQTKEFSQPDTTVTISTNEFEVSPDTKTAHEVLRGLAPVDTEYVITYPDGTANLFDVDLESGTKDWNGASGDLVFSVRIRIHTGGTGAYTVRLRAGHRSPSTEIVSQVLKTGTLQVDGNNTWTTYTHTSALTLWPSTVEGPSPTKDIYAQIEITCVEQAAQQIVGTSTPTEGDYVPTGEATIHEALDKRNSPWTEVDAKLATSPSMANTEKKVFIMKLDTPVAAPKAGHEIHVRYKAENTSQRLNIRLLEDDLAGGYNQIKDSGNITPPGTTATDHALALTVADVALISDITKLYLEIGFTGGGAGSGSTNYVPTSHEFSRQFTKFGSGTDHGVVGDNSDSTGWESSNDVIDYGDVLDEVKFKFTNVLTPGDATGTHTVTVRVAATDPNDIIRYELRDGDTGTTVAKDSHTLTSASFSNVSFNLTAAEKAKITNYQNLDVHFIRKTGSKAASTTRLAEVDLDFPVGGTTGIIYSAAYRPVISTTIDTSWVHLSAELSTNFIPGDTIKVYAGTKEELFELVADDFPWDNVSKSGGPYAGADESKSWSFATWGDKIIATNFADPVQVKNIGDTAFRDLFGFDNAGSAITDYAADGFEKPRGKYVATINAFLCMANIDDASYTDGRSYSLWCSAIGDPTRIHPASFEKQSSIFQIVATPGEITGLVGGEYGLLLKENSVYRMDYVGVPGPLFNFTQISSMQGTPFPRSVVQVEHDVYFWGSGDIFVIRGGRSAPAPLGRGQVDKLLFDAMFEDLALTNNTSSDSRVNDSKVVGSYDPYSGLLIWSYRSNSGGEYLNDMLVVYNPSEDRFSLLPGDQIVTPSTTVMPSVTDIFTGTFKNQGIVSLGNRLSGQDHLMRSTFLFERSGTKDKLQQLSSNATYETFWRTGTITANEFPGIKPGQDLTIHEVRPIYVIEEGAQDPNFLVWIQGGEKPPVSILS